MVHGFNLAPGWKGPSWIPAFAGIFGDVAHGSLTLQLRVTLDGEAI